MDRSEVQETVKAFIRERYLAEEGLQELTDSTPLITGGILNSLSTLELVSFLEETYNIDVQAHEVGVHNLNTLAEIAIFVESKQ